MFSIRTCVSALAAIAALTAGAGLASRALGQQKPTPPPPAAGAEGLRNVQVLTGLHDVLPVMHVMRAALGVTCDYCHVAERDQYWRDDKPEKVRARQMMLMMAEINRANFAGRTVVTCNTCHRGSPHPVNTPAIGQGAFADTTHAEPQAAAPAPAAAEVLDAYLKAAGGRERLAALSSRAARITLLRAATVDGGTAQARAVNRGQAVQVETVQLGPDRQRYVRLGDGGAPALALTLAQGRGWIQTPQGTRPMAAADIEQIQREWRAALDLGRELDAAKRLGAAGRARRDSLDGRAVYVVSGPAAEAGATERLYFDAATGLLTRRLVLRPTQVGPDPEQTDYADYRAVDGVLLPFRITTSYLDDNHLGVTRIFNAVRHNAPVDPHAFDPPPVPKTP